MNSILFVILCVYVTEISSQNTNSTEWCIDSKFHKKVPTKERELYAQCEPWAENSCCTYQTSIISHQAVNQYDFNLNHCPENPMSYKCRQHFAEDLCFYECEPNLKPWVAKVELSYAHERFINAPLCASQCNQWWSDCEHDFTCVNNWSKNFHWVNHTNFCPQDAGCKPMNQIFSGAQEFCELVWDHSWRYTPDDIPCMKISFNGTNGNPNKATADYYANNKLPEL